MGRRRTAAEIDELVGRYRASGLSRMEFSQREGLPISTLHRYVRQRSNGSDGQRLVRVHVETASERDRGFALVLGNGRRIEACWGFEEAELARLIRVAE